MSRNYVSEFKSICTDALKYGPDIAINRYRYDVAKAKDKFDTEALAKMHRSILAYLKRKYAYLIEKYKDEPIFQERTSDTYRNTIWCFWWQGLENAPELVKCCVASIQRNNPECDVITINRDSFSQYVSIPQHILGKVQTGAISFTHFSDVLRFYLLNQQGGIWMDSTIFCVNPIAPEFRTARYYTPKSPEAITECVANYRWATYMQAGAAGHIVFRYMAELYDQYFQEHTSVIHYFLTDYMLQLAFENIPSIRQILDNIPINNEERGFLSPHLSAAYDETFSLDALKDRSDFYKLFWKQKCEEYTPDGKPTVWHHIKDY